MKKDERRDFVQRQVDYFYGHMSVELECEAGVPIIKEPAIISSEGYSPLELLQAQLDVYSQEQVSDAEASRLNAWIREEGIVVDAINAMLRYGVSLDHVEMYLRDLQQWNWASIVRNRAGLERELSSRFIRKGAECDFDPIVTPTGGIVHIKVKRPGDEYFLL